MTNKELAAQCLIEAADLLNEGEKGLTMINNYRTGKFNGKALKDDLDALKKEHPFIGKIAEKNLNMTNKKYKKALNDHNIKKLEKFGKSLRNINSGYTKKMVKLQPYLTDSYGPTAKLATGVINKDQSKDPEKARRNNIKLGYLAAKNITESAYMDSLLEEANELLYE